MHDAFVYDGRTIQVKGQKVKVPHFTKFEEKCSCGDCHLAYIPEIDKYYCNENETNFLSSIGPVLLVLTIFAFELWSLCLNYTDITLLSFIIIGAIIHVFWLLGHLEAMCASPGHLPWFWSVEQRRDYSYQEMWSGIISNGNQYEFAVNGVSPERSFVSHAGRYIVLRADMNCGWINNWVGSKNYRYFFVMMIWLFAVFLFYFATFFSDVAVMAKKGWSVNAPRIVLLITIIPVIAVFISFMRIFIIMFRNMLHNKTNVFDEDKKNVYNLGVDQNCEELFGPYWCSPCWFFPIPLPSVRDGMRWVRNDGVKSTCEMAVKDVEYEQEEKEKEKLYKEDDFYIPPEVVNKPNEVEEVKQPPVIIPKKEKGESMPNIILEDANSDSENIYLIEYSDEFTSGRMTSQDESIYALTSESNELSGLTSSSEDDGNDFYTGENGEVTNKMTTVTGFSEPLPEPDRQRHRIRKTVIGRKSRHPIPPEMRNVQSPRLEYNGPRVTIDVKEKDEPIRFFSFK